MKTRNYSIIITVILLGLFFFTGMEKVWHHRSFAIQLGRQPLPDWMKAMLEWGLPLAELAIVALLAIGRRRLLGLWASAVAMVCFAGYTAYAATEPLGYVPCACGKLFSSLSWGQHFWVNMAFAALAVVGIWLHRTRDNATTIGVNDNKHIAQSPG